MTTEEKMKSLVQSLNDKVSRTKGMSFRLSENNNTVECLVGKYRGDKPTSKSQYNYVTDIPNVKYGSNSTIRNMSSYWCSIVIDAATANPDIIFEIIRQ